MGSNGVRYHSDDSPQRVGDFRKWNEEYANPETTRGARKRTTSNTAPQTQLNIESQHCEALGVLHNDQVAFKTAHDMMNHHPYFVFRLRSAVFQTLCGLSPFFLSCPQSLGLIKLHVGDTPQVPLQTLSVRRGSQAYRLLLVSFLSYLLTLFPAW